MRYEPTKTITAAKIITLINTDLDRTMTLTSFYDIPEGYTAQERNWDRKVISTVTWDNGELGTTETVLTYPTAYTDYPHEYWWWGTYESTSSNPDGESPVLSQPTASTCVTQARGAVRLPSHPPMSQFIEPKTQYVFPDDYPGGEHEEKDIDGASFMLVQGFVQVAATQRYSTPKFCEDSTAPAPTRASEGDGISVCEQLAINNTYNADMNLFWKMAFPDEKPFQVCTAQGALPPLALQGVFYLTESTISYTSGTSGGPGHVHTEAPVSTLDGPEPPVGSPPQGIFPGLNPIGLDSDLVSSSAPATAPVDPATVTRATGIVPSITAQPGGGSENQVNVPTGNGRPATTRDASGAAQTNVDGPQGSNQGDSGGSIDNGSGTRTITLGNQPVTATPVSVVTTINGQPTTAPGLVIGGTTYLPGQTATVDGVSVAVSSLTAPGDGLVLVADADTPSAITVTVPAVPAPSTALTIDGVPVTAHLSGLIVYGSTISSGITATIVPGAGDTGPAVTVFYSTNVGGGIATSLITVNGVTTTVRDSSASATPTGSGSGPGTSTDGESSETGELNRARRSLAGDAWWALIPLIGVVAAVL